MEQAQAMQQIEGVQKNPRRGRKKKQKKNKKD